MSFYQVSYDHRTYERNLSNCVKKPEKVRTSTGFEPVTLRYRCDVRSNQLSYEATDVRSWSFVSSNESVKNGCEVRVIDKATTGQSAITNNVTVVTPLNLGQVIKR